MANAAAFKNFQGYTDIPYTVVLEYDFANDTGAAATYSLGKFKHKTMILHSRMFVETACTSGGSATVKVGVGDEDDDAICKTTSGAVANLTDNAVVAETASTNLVVPADDTVDLVIGTAALTAGKIKVILTCINVE